MSVNTVTPRRHFIYGLLDPRTEAIYYVGQTTSLSDRFIAHLCSGSKKRKLSPVEQYNVELLKSGNRPKLIRLDSIETPHRDIVMRLEECWRVHMINENELLANAWKTGRCIDTDNPMAEAEYIKGYALATIEQIVELRELDNLRAMQKVWR